MSDMPDSFLQFMSFNLIKDKQFSHVFLKHKAISDATHFRIWIHERFFSLILMPITHFYFSVVDYRLVLSTVKKSRCHKYFPLNSQYAHTGNKRLDRSWPYTSKITYLRQHINSCLVEKYIYIIFQMKTWSSLHGQK